MLKKKVNLAIVYSEFFLHVTLVSLTDARPIDNSKEVKLECLMGGRWNIDRIPKCTRESIMKSKATSMICVLW